MGAFLQAEKVLSQVKQSVVGKKKKRMENTGRQANVAVLNQTLQVSFSKPTR